MNERDTEGNMQQRKT